MNILQKRNHRRQTEIPERGCRWRENPEKIIREEMRSWREIAFRLCQWGVGVLASLQTAIFLIRKEIYAYLIAHGKLDPEQYQYLPWDRYLIGTGGLVMVAFIFTLMSIMVGRRYQFHVRLLETHSESGLPNYRASVFGRVLVCLLYFLFPALDVAIRVYVRLHFELGMHQ